MGFKLASSSQFLSWNSNAFYDWSEIKFQILNYCFSFPLSSLRLMALVEIIELFLIIYIFWNLDESVQKKRDLHVKEARCFSLRMTKSALLMQWNSIIRLATACTLWHHINTFGHDLCKQLILMDLYVIWELKNIIWFNDKIDKHSL
jgi:hypothetical protein